MQEFTSLDRLIDAALDEDIGRGDLTTALLIPEGQDVTLDFIAREPLTICGVHVLPDIFRKCDPRIYHAFHLTDGQHAEAGARIATVRGEARGILTAERVALNIFQHMCGVATLTARFTEAVEGTGVLILDTRKTLPGFRELDKYAVRTGGGRNHRLRLDDGILIKDNHIAICGSIAAAVERLRPGVSSLLKIAVECDTPAQVEEALETGVDRVLLDNMPLEDLRASVTLVKGRAETEASGGVTLENVRAIAETGVDYISVGAITHSAANCDIGLDIGATPSLGLKRLYKRFQAN